ncbi:hypothetical protein BDW75DRAFT_231462 [Aspergillus navahoensis]
MSTPDITLYTDNTPNGHKIPIILEELGLSYKLKQLSIQTGEQKKEWFLKISPNGQIPALTNAKQRVFDSGAILLYLADKYNPEGKVSYRPGTPEYYKQLSWIFWQISSLGLQGGAALSFSTFTPVRSDYVIEKFLGGYKNLLGVLEHRLKESPYLAGEKYTIADIAWPHVKAWMDKIVQRAAVQKGLVTPKPPFNLEQFKVMLRAQREVLIKKENSEKY